jgi:hypothetical protein
VSLGILASTAPAARRPWLLGAWWLAGFGHAVAGDLGVEPVAALVVVTWLWAVREALRAPVVAAPVAAGPSAAS